QSGGSTPKALAGYGIEEGAWSSDEEMFGLIHQMRSRIITSPCFGSGKVIGAILFERTMDGEVDGKPVPQALIERGIVPFIKSADRADSDRLLLTAILEELGQVPEGNQVMLKLSLPAEAGLFEPLIDHPKVLRVVALSGGFSRAEACRELARNPGMIASFSRALLSDLRAQQSDDEFDRTLGGAIDEIYSASTAKVPA